MQCAERATAQYAVLARGMQGFGLRDQQSAALGVRVLNSV